MCMAALQQARVSHVTYGASDPKGGAISLGYQLHNDKRLNHQFSVDFNQDILCSEVLTRFFKKKRDQKL